MLCNSVYWFDLTTDILPPPTNSHCCKGKDIRPPWIMNFDKQCACKVHVKLVGHIYRLDVDPRNISANVDNSLNISSTALFDKIDLFYCFGSCRACGNKKSLVSNSNKCARQFVEEPLGQWDAGRRNILTSQIFKIFFFWCFAQDAKGFHFQNNIGLMVWKLSKGKPGASSSL